MPRSFDSTHDGSQSTSTVDRVVPAHDTVLHDTIQHDTVQLITPDGTRVPHEFDRWVPDPLESLLEMYREMVTLRRIDHEGTALQRAGELGLWVPSLGQEAAQIGSAHALRSDDFVFSTYREHGVALHRGAEPLDLMRQWRGNGRGWDPYRIGMASPQIIIGAHGLHAVGYALGIQNDGADAVAVAYFGDGAMSEGDVSEAMTFAATFGAPVIFLCQNNQWAISEPVSLQTRVPLADRATGFGIPTMRVDGNDALAMLAATRLAADRARTGGGPTFIEAVTYRMGPHTTADDPTRYRPDEELAYWAARDPIARVEALLLAEGTLSDEGRTRIAAEADAVAATLREGVLALEDPDPLSVFDHIYAEPHAQLDRQRDQYRRYLEGFAEAGA